MKITPHVEQLQRQLLSAAAAGGPETEELAGRLATALAAAGRLAILEALAEAVGDITAELSPGSVDLRLRGRDVDFVVTRPSAPSTPAPATATAEPAGEPADTPDDAGTSRTTLRLPDTLKTRAEQAAAVEAVSLNTWLVRAVTAALEPSRRSVPNVTGSTYTGWVR
jgi:hypothetical protein